MLSENRNLKKNADKFSQVVFVILLPGVFPEPNKDPVIQIANMVIRQGEKDPFIRNVFTLKETSSIIGADVICFDTEEELLKVCQFYLL